MKKRKTEKMQFISKVLMLGMLIISVSFVSCKGQNHLEKPETPPESKIIPPNSENSTVSSISEIIIPKNLKELENADGYLIEWTDSSGKNQKTTVLKDKTDIILPGGIKIGTTPTVTPLKEDSSGKLVPPKDAMYPPPPCCRRLDCKRYYSIGKQRMG